MCQKYGLVQVCPIISYHLMCEMSMEKLDPNLVRYPTAKKEAEVEVEYVQDCCIMAQSFLKIKEGLANRRYGRLQKIVPGLSFQTTLRGLWLPLGNSARFS